MVYELVRRIAAGACLPRLHGKRVTPLSMGRRASSLKKPDEQMRPKMQKMISLTMIIIDPALRGWPWRCSPSGMVFSRKTLRPRSGPGVRGQIRKSRW